jgi:hypothetical protein
LAIAAAEILRREFHRDCRRDFPPGVARPGLVHGLSKSLVIATHGNSGMPQPASQIVGAIPTQEIRLPGLSP